jgi:hypothetical protein
MLVTRTTVDIDGTPAEVEANRRERSSAPDQR